MKIRHLLTLFFSIFLVHLSAQEFNSSDYEIAFITKDVTPDGDLEEQGIIEDLRKRGFTVDVTYNDPGDITVTPDFEFSFAALNNYDLVILGRGVSSGDFTEADKWAAVQTPIIVFSAYLVRSSRMKLVNSSSASREVSDGGTVARDTVTNIKIEAHPVFTGLDGNVDGEIGYMTWFYDYVKYGVDTFPANHNGTLLGTWADPTGVADGNVAVAHWASGVEPYPGAGITLAADRMYLQMGSDDSNSPKLRNFTAFTNESTLLLHNSIKLLVGASPDGKLIPITQEAFDPRDYSIAFITKDVNPGGSLEEQGVVDDLRSRGFTVDVSYNDPGDISVTPDFDFSFAGLNDYDLVILGRGVSSGDFTEAEAWAAVQTPIIVFSAYLVRSSRMKLINSSSASREVSDASNVSRDTITNIKIEDHPVFTGLDRDGDGEIGYMTWFYDYVKYGVDTFPANHSSTLLGGWADPTGVGNGNVAVAHWASGVEPYPGAGITLAGDRMYLQMGSDDSSSPKLRNYTAFTEESTLLLHNSIKLLLGGTPDGSLIPVEPGARIGKIAFITKDVDEAGYLEEIEVIDELRKRGYQVDVSYNDPGDITVPADFEFSFEALNDYDAVIIGRGVSSGDFTQDSAWAAVEAPVIIFSAYLVRSTRLKLINSSSASRENGDGNAVAMDRVTNVGIADHPIFTGVDTDEDDKISYLTWFYDYIKYGVDTFEMNHNASLLATLDDSGGVGDGNVYIAHWASGVEPYPGAGITLAGDRLYMQMGSDDSNSPKLRNYTAFTDESWVVLFNALELLSGGMPSGVLPDAGPVANWNMDESGVAILDGIGSANGDIRNGNGISREACGVNESINFAGATKPSAVIWVDDQASINFGMESSFTLSAWVKMDPYANEAEMNIMLKGDNKNDGTHLENGNGHWYTLATKSRELRFALDDDVTKTQLGVAIDSTSFPPDQWNHVVGVRDATQDSLFLYLNGVKVGSLKDDTDGDISTTGLPLVLGNYHSGVRVMNGNLDEVSIYDVALGDMAISNLFNSASPSTNCTVIETISELSVDANLSALSLDVGTLVPDFDPSITSYTAEVPEGTSAVTISATASNENATVSGDGTFSNIPGVATIDVVAEDTTSIKAYTIGIKIEGAGNSRTIVEPGFENLFNAVNDAISGDTLVLRNGGDYSPLAPYAIGKKIVIIAETIPTLPALDNMPKIDNLFGVSPVFKMENGGDLVLIGIDVDGGQAANIIDCQGDFGVPSTQSIFVNRCRLHNTTDDILNDARDGNTDMTTLERGIFRNTFIYDSGSGHGLYVKNYHGEGDFVFENLTFWNLGEQFNWIRHFPAEITQTYVYDHMTGYKLSTDVGDNKEIFGNSDAETEAALNITLKNSILHTQVSDNEGSLKFNNTTGRNTITTNNNVLFNVKPIVDGGGSITHTDNQEVDPMFADPDNGDFTVMNTALHSAADDGEIIGALYWHPDYVDDFADLVSVDDIEVLKVNLKAFPNPFTNNTNLSFHLEESTRVQVNMYDLMGKQVKTVLNENMLSGYHQLEVPTQQLVPGIYLIQFVSDGIIITRKVVKK